MAENSKADRLRAARRASGYRSASVAARSLNISPATYIHHENGTREFNEEAARVYGKRFHVSWLWLLYGEGEMQSAEDKQKILEEQAEAASYRNALTDEQRELRDRESMERKVAETLEQVENMTFVPLVNPGFTSQWSKKYWPRFINLTEKVYHEIVNYWAIPTANLSIVYNATASACIIYPMVGDLMSPAFGNGDFVLVDTDFSEHTGDGIYLISQPDGIPEFRHVHGALGVDPPSVIVSAESPSFRPQTVAIDSILFVGKAIARISKI